MDDGVAVTGTGAVAGAPDVVRARLAASTLRPGVAEAVSAADTAVRAIREALARAGVTGQDAATAGMSLTPEQVWTDGAAPRVVGYRCEHSLAVTIRDLTTVGAALGDALAAGAGDAVLYGLQFEVENPAALRARARDLAWADARARAEQLAGLAGRALGAVEAISEGLAAGGPVVPLALRATADEVAAQPAHVTVEVSLFVRWGLA